MGFSSTRLAVENQRASFGDEIRSQVGTEQRLTQGGLQTEVELINGLEEGEVSLAGKSAAGGFAYDAPLLRPAEEQENRDSSSFLSRLDPPGLGRYDVCVPGSTVGIEAPVALPRVSAFFKFGPEL